MIVEQPRRWFLITEATLQAFAACLEMGNVKVVKQEIEQMLKERTPLSDEQLNAIRSMLRMVHGS